MTENELRKALHENRPLPPSGFEERSDRQLKRLTAKEEKPMKKFSTGVLVFLLLLILTMAAAVAEGLFPWTRGLEDRLQVTDEIKDAYKEEELFDEPQLSVTQNGVTVTLDQCIVDTHAAYIAFRVQGYAPELGKQPAFDGTDVDLVDAQDRGTSGWGSSFFDGLVTGPDGRGMYPDGRIPEDFGKLPYANENGDLLYVISMRADGEAFSYVGKKIHVTLKDLGVYANKWGDVDVAVAGTWEFEWTLKGTDKRLELNDLNLPIGENGSVLTAVRLSPIHVRLEMNVPRHPEADPDEFDLYAPYFRGVVLKDGTEYDLISNGGVGGYLDETGEAYRAMSALSRVIEPDQVAALLFTDLPSENRVEVKLP